MKRYALVALAGLMVLAPVAAAAHPSAAKACLPAPYHQFDFWLGSWRVTTPDGKYAGSNNITRELGGCTIQEHWDDTDGHRGMSFNIYDARRKGWHQTWVDEGGGLLLLDGAFAGGIMRMRETRKHRIDEIAWTPNKDGSVRQLWRTSTDGGASWKVAFDGLYRKVKPVPEGTIPSPWIERPAAPSAAK